MSTLKVGTIQDHTNSNNALLIDSSGRVTAPANPKFSASLGTSIGVADYTATSGIGTDAFTVPLDTEDFDIGNCLGISGTVATFTAPITGYYNFNLSCMFQNATQAGHINIYFDVNGVLENSNSDDDYRVIENPGGANYLTLTNSALIYVPSGQTVQPAMYVSGDTSIGIRKGTRFQGFLVP
tara:strand:+ start:196 stop:741 length:546 start_codon:yes stop_codon:yes gene_type:complete